MAKLLLDNGADMSKCDGGPDRLLDYACRMGLEKLLEVLIDHGAPVDGDEAVLARTQSRGWETPAPLYRACSFGHLNVVKVLLTHGANANLPSASNYGRTALHVACEGERLQIAQMLINHGANVRAKDHQGTTPMLHAVRINKLRLVEFLASHTMSCLLAGVAVGRFFEEQIAEKKVEGVSISVNIMNEEWWQKASPQLAQSLQNRGVVGLVCQQVWLG